MEQHEYIYDASAEYRCVWCGEIEMDNEPWLPQHLIPEGWE